jgi:eukaryotic-like serine/threonine-protein kinase
MAQPTVTSDNVEHTLLAQKLEALGPYRLQHIIGEGGMGAVYLAQQFEPVRRQVAIKVTRIDLANVGRLARFEAERQILATLQHHGIARVLDAGETPEGFPYMVMEFIQGQAIDAYCDAQRLPVNDRVALLMQACDAVLYAHQHGIIHRDIKPSNFLIDTASGKPIAKLIDFGIAKLIDQPQAAALTQTGHVVGTPAYMSPEQRAGLPDIDTRTDVFALGMTLYRLLAAGLPQAKETAQIGTRAADYLEPQRPSKRVSDSDDADVIAARYQTRADQLVRLLSRDLDWIVLKAIATDRSQRYDSVSDLRDDLQRYLNGFPVIASPPSVWQSARKFAARHRVESFLACVFLTFLGGALFALITSWRAERLAHAEATAQLRQHENFNAFVMHVLATAKPRKPGSEVTVMQALQTAREEAPKQFKDDIVTRTAMEFLLLQLVSQAQAVTRPAEPIPAAAEHKPPP